MLRVVTVLLLVMTTSCPLWATDEVPTRFPAAPRIVAIGDLHGDLEATRRALRLCGAIGEDDHWTGGDLVLVQTGDQLDRGDGEQAILELLENLVAEATAAGGSVHLLNGNHELMNAKLDLRYVTEGGFADFDDAVTVPADDPALQDFDEAQRARVVAFRPGGPYATILARRNTIAIIGDIVFVHGGVRPAHLDYGIERINREVRSWLRGDSARQDTLLNGDAVIWVRDYSDEVDGDDCARLAEVLDRLGARSMVVGHTVQEGGIRSDCDGRVWCIDSGISEYYGGTVEALEIRGDEIRVLRE